MTRSLSSSGNLLKMGYLTRDTETRMINSNELLAKRLEEIAQHVTPKVAEGSGEESLSDGNSGFMAGLSAEQEE